jgi:hypothetical protein
MSPIPGAPLIAVAAKQSPRDIAMKHDPGIRNLFQFASSNVGLKTLAGMLCSPSFKPLETANNNDPFVSAGFASVVGRFAGSVRYLTNYTVT